MTTAIDDDSDIWPPTSAQRIEQLNCVRMSLDAEPDYDMILEGEVVLSTSCFGDWTVPAIRNQPITLRDVIMTLDYLHTREFDDHRFIEGIEITIQDGVTTVEFFLGS